MNYYRARQRKDKKWDFTCRYGSDGPTYAVGYCHAFRPYSEKEVKEWHIPPEKVKIHDDRKPKYHTHGHDTEKEACACYRQYLLDTKLHFYDDNPTADTQRKCKVCGVFTSGYGEVDCGELIPLCQAHRTRATFERIYPEVGYITSSY